MSYSDWNYPRRPHLPVVPPDSMRVEVDIAIMRWLVEFMCFPQECSPRCRRAKRCTDPVIGCFDANLPMFQAFCEALANWPRLEGERERHDMARDAKHLFD